MADHAAACEDVESAIALTRQSLHDIPGAFRVFGGFSYPELLGPLVQYLRAAGGEAGNDVQSGRVRRPHTRVSWPE